MPVYEYKDLLINLSDQDTEYTGYFEAAQRHELVVKKCLDCELLRGEPGAACPWCTSMRWEWHAVSGKGTIYSYQIIPHAILPGFRDWEPYPVVLVELDEQSGAPKEHDGLRITANLLDENMAPESEENVAIGKRVKVVFLDVDKGLTLPQFALSSEQPERLVWKHAT